MSRSFKKTPIVKDNRRGRKFAKKQANKKVRKTKNIPDGKHYRKVYNPWDIYDYVSYCSLEEFKNSKWLRYHYGTDQELIKAWRRDFYNK